MSSVHINFTAWDVVEERANASVLGSLGGWSGRESLD